MEAALDDDVALVTTMWANNEVGTLNPVHDIARLCAERGVPFHTDAVQAVGAVPVHFADSGASALTMTGHKVGGPYGVGVLLLARDVKCTPLLHGGGQERDVRSGTLDAPSIVGLARAVRIAVEDQARRAAELLSLRDELISSVRAVVPDVIVNGDPLGPPARQRAPDVPRLRGRQPADAARRARHRVLDRLRVHGRCRATEPRAARDGRGAFVGSRFAAVLAGPHVHA